MTANYIALIAAEELEAGDLIHIDPADGKTRKYVMGNPDQGQPFTVPPGSLADVATGQLKIPERVMPLPNDVNLTWREPVPNPTVEVNGSPVTPELQLLFEQWGTVEAVVAMPGYLTVTFKGGAVVEFRPFSATIYDR